MTERTVRSEQIRVTRESILTTAERLFAEHGVFAVSNRQISEAAGLGNNTAVSYHFGTKADLVRAIVREHSGRIEQLRRQLLANVGNEPEVRDWVDCLVRPSAEHLATLGCPTWYARFAAQVMTEPSLHGIMVEESLTSPDLHRIIDGFDRSLPDLPPQVRSERFAMSRQLMAHMYAERERALAEGVATPRASWHDAATGLVDAVTGLWLAPVTG
ncbi:TetR/AcrR family transcriptional regulator [Actinopolyspora halophila]|uniref:TetR/AcrR family transcriptional regulator n=1 Tax=Actinopolyspora halophila TaxID=1850 RepID=UPI000476B892|nr:TetR family transcriptional regulator [Actinopolyspora halophila]